VRYRLVAGSAWWARLVHPVATAETAEKHLDDLADDAEHDHAQPLGVGRPGAETVLELSPQAAQTIGLTRHEVSRQDYHRSLALPAVVVERPGRSALSVSAPMTGIVTQIHPLQGAVVSPGAALLDLRLTHEDLVEKQAALLRDLEQLDVINLEVDRLQDVASSGAVPGRRLLEPVYEKQKLEGAIRAEREALLLHGLTPEQIESILRDRELIKSVVVFAPSPDERHAAGVHEDFFQVAQLLVRRGDHVTTGTPLMTLTDHCQLYIQGQAFEQDAAALHQAAGQGTPVTALIESDGATKQEVSDLRVLYVENQVDADSRALKFYVELPNELLADRRTADEQRFVAWRYKPGQRVELLVPVETWPDRLVVPAGAVVVDGADSYVYRLHGGHVDRIPVSVEYRDQRSVVLGRDTPLQPGESVAVGGAYQLHLAFQQQAGVPLDPHAGHGH
jgi:multidrug efflux pump subunit AcrA (membrane-fusion protein)